MSKLNFFYGNEVSKQREGVNLKSYETCERFFYLVLQKRLGCQFKDTEDLISEVGVDFCGIVDFFFCYRNLECSVILSI